MGIYKKIEHAHSQFHNQLNKIKWRLKYRNEVALLKGNIDLKDSHIGEKCFIIANGPSVNKQDLSLLENQFAFTVNRMVTKEDFSSIKSNVHIWSDMDFFTEELFEKGDMLDVLLSTNTNGNRPLCFFPVAAKPILDKYKISETLDINYFKQNLELYENYDENIDLCNLIINGSTVILVAIAIAVYMGFKEINLLGCDCTSAKGYIDSYGKNQVSEYAFKIPKEQESLLAQSTIFKRTSEYEFRNFYYVFKNYRIIGEYCNKRGIKIFNCTEGGVLDTFPLKTLEEALKS